MNPFVLFLPTFRASTTAFLLGLVILAVFDYVRLNFGIPFIPGWILMLAVWFFVFSIQANRRRHAGESAAFALLPTFLALLGKGIGTVVGIFPPIFDAMRAYAAENGVDVDDEAAFQQTVADPQFQEAFQAYLTENEAMLEGIIAATAMPSFIGFWLVIGLFAIWFAQMKRTGGTLDDAAPAAVSPATTPETAPEPESEVAEAPSEPEPAVEPEDTPVGDAAPEETADAEPSSEDSSDDADTESGAATEAEASSDDAETSGDDGDKDKPSS